MRRIAHISDLHFLLTEQAVVEALAAERSADPPDLVAVSGGLTMRARSREFRAARAFIDSLRAPVLAAPGNHDITSYWLHERFLDSLGRWRRFIAEEPEPAWADGESAGLLGRTVPALRGLRDLTVDLHQHGVVHVCAERGLHRLKVRREWQKPGALRRELDRLLAEASVQGRGPDLKHAVGAPW